MLFLLLACAGGCSPQNLSPPPDADYVALRQLDPLRQRLERADAASANLALTEIGRVSYGAFQAPVWRVAYRPFQAELKQVLILAALRGNDTAAVEFVADFVERLEGRAQQGSALWDLDIIPIVNPWGWVHGLASNRIGVDIGSDFAAFDSQEARLMRRFLREKRYDLVIELREDAASGGFFIGSQGTGDERVSLEIMGRIRNAGYLVADRSANVPLWRVRLMRILRQMTAAGYIRQNAGHRVFTVLAPAGLPLADRIAMHRIAVETLLTEYASAP